MVLAIYKPRVLVVTGSVGKTSAKDAAYATLSTMFFVRRSEKSFNSDVGVPLTILGVPNGWANPARWVRNIIDGFFLLVLRAPYPTWLVVEVGADRPGDITRSLSWLKPEVVIATRFPALSVHVEFYESPADVQKEELAPLGWLTPGGVAVVNADDALARAYQTPEGVEKVLYGFSEYADVKASKLHTLVTDGMPRGVSCDVLYKGERAHVSLSGVVGTPPVYAILAGVAAAVAVGVPLKDAVMRLKQEHETPPGRLRLIEGVKDSVLIDDSYNASPVAVEEALKTLKDIPRRGRRIALLGDMLELGAYSVAEHAKAGEIASQSADILITVGVRARGFAAGALKAGMQKEVVLEFDRAADAAEHVLSVVGEGDVILIKGSQGVRMERAVKVLMARPEEAKKLLPRQDAEWLTR